MVMNLLYIAFFSSAIVGWSIFEFEESAEGPYIYDRCGFLSGWFEK